MMAIKATYAIVAIRDGTTAMETCRIIYDEWR
jgi:hypothetical protein